MINAEKGVIRLMGVGERERERMRSFFWGFQVCSALSFSFYMCMCVECTLCSLSLSKKV